MACYSMELGTVGFSFHLRFQGKITIGLGPPELVNFRIIILGDREGLNVTKPRRYYQSGFLCSSKY